jgi:hypothetical protein
MLAQTSNCWPSVPGTLRVSFFRSSGADGTMSKRRRGGYLGGSTLIPVSAALPLERTKQHNAKVQVERKKFAVEQRVFEQNKTSRLIKADSPEGRKQRAKRQAEREAQRFIESGPESKRRRAKRRAAQRRAQSANAMNQS